MRNKTVRVLANIGQILALCTAALGSTSYALDRHIKVGAACVPQYQSYSYKRELSGVLRNTSGSDQIWECPLMRRNNNSIQRVGVRVLNYGFNTDNVVCSLKSRWYNGAAFQEISRTAAKGSTWITFENGIQVKPFGGVSLRCFVPEKSGNTGSAIVNYFMEY